MFMQGFRAYYAAFIAALIHGVHSGYIDAPHVPLAKLQTTVQDPWQWWYFDLLSNEGTALQIVYFSGYGFGPLSPVPFYIQVSATLPNGTSLVTLGLASGYGSVSQSVGDYSNGAWPGLGGWNSTASQYTVRFEDGLGYVSGNLTLDMTTPPHYPCDEPNDPSFSTTVAPNLVGPWLGWSNAVPGATGDAHLTVGKQTYTFSGNGYHDSNFGMKQLSENTNQWYWGRGAVGPYTFVYFAYLPKGSSVPASDPNTWYTSGFLSKDGTKIVNFCSVEQNGAEHTQQHITLETRGKIWTELPLLVGTPDDSEVGVVVTYTINGEDYVFNMSSMAVSLAGGPILPYARWTSSIQGGKVGEDPATGYGNFEILNYGDD
ncbi:hypothetical protein PUNSTDRAFT_140930 [Punctularia strigosozonata HHB-11173 SS5]|uniref:uncharacterized protein n=1 Tax=Punctularia strigosozonata (strain HHB-11173) TaxID=741275 RepID=UPI000441760D|nr:uncharacterized protein PUNSTDRAFT_140930 [Punctularia strigosozonata HHB-11173 SS5]EIN14703.1 hypothetical protein PUNSTDRAFT_140930 [Punctularia strigosozonata HHB-11173 SS5]